LAKLKALNRNFYPVPVREVKTDTPGVLLRHEKISEGFLTKTSFVAAYQKCSVLIHTTNPYSESSPLDFHGYSRAFAEWKNQCLRKGRSSATFLAVTSVSQHAASTIQESS
jgi:hypothetical protein